MCSKYIKRMEYWFTFLNELKFNKNYYSHNPFVGKPTCISTQCVYTIYIIL